MPTALSTATPTAIPSAIPISCPAYLSVPTTKPNGAASIAVKATITQV
jgi:hypothetical protein